MFPYAAFFSLFKTILKYINVTEVLLVRVPYCCESSQTQM